MANPTIKIHNIEMDETIEREMTDAEVKAHEEKLALYKVEADAATAKEAAKEAAKAKLEALGLTLDDLKALGL